ncbi:MAG: LysM peptidoglycan-binding domain-containing protein [Ilumatobacteraceae bacterium]
MRSSVPRSIGAAVLGASLLGLTACGGDSPSSSASTVPIQPSSYVIKEPVTASTVPPAVAGPNAEGRSDGEQTYIVASRNDVPFSIARMYEVDLDELRNFNGWEEGTYAGFPGIGGAVRIPPGAKYIDPAATTTTAPAATTGTEGDSTDETASGGDRCAPTYVVESGDAPLVITRKFDITLDQLNAANTSTANWPNLYTGATINLPPPADCTGGAATTTLAG